MNVYRERMCAALDMVISSARSEIYECQELIGKRTLGMTQEQHDQYYRQRVIEAKDALDWLQSRLGKLRLE